MLVLPEQIEAEVQLTVDRDSKQARERTRQLDLMVRARRMGVPVVMKFRDIIQFWTPITVSRSRVELSMDGQKFDCSFTYGRYRCCNGRVQLDVDDFGQMMKILDLIQAELSGQNDVVRLVGSYIWNFPKPITGP